MDAINQVFALFRVNFHNQYYKAFPDDSILKQVKKLWFESLRPFGSDTILKATKNIVESQEYLPTLNQMLSQCSMSMEAAPDPHTAYLEACRAPSPKAQYSWSHPAVYRAGQKTDWFFLASTNEQTVFPIFKSHYLQALRDYQQYPKNLELPAKATAEAAENKKPVISKKKGLAKVQALRENLRL